MKTTGRLFPMDETLKLARAHPYVAVLRNGTWNFMQTSPEGELPICKEEATFDIYSLGDIYYLNEEDTPSPFITCWRMNILICHVQITVVIYHSSDFFSQFFYKNSFTVSRFILVFGLIFFYYNCSIIACIFLSLKWNLSIFRIISIFSISEIIFYTICE